MQADEGELSNQISFVQCNLTSISKNPVTKYWYRVVMLLILKSIIIELEE